MKNLIFSLLFICAFVPSYGQSDVIVESTSDEKPVCGGPSTKIEITTPEYTFVIPGGATAAGGTRKLVGKIEGNPKYFGFECPGCPDPADKGCIAKVTSVFGLTDYTIDGDTIKFPSQKISVYIKCTGCTETSDSRPEDESEAIAEPSALDRSFKLYPNPTQSVVHIELLDSDDSQYDIQILSMAGKQVKYIKMLSSSTNSNRQIIDLSDVAKGMYIVNLRSSNGLSESKRLIVQ